MGYQIDDKNDEYISITLTGMMDKQCIISALSELLNHPDYHKKHSLWDFSEARMGLTLGDLSEIIGVLRLFKTIENKFANRSALVITGKLQLAMGNVFISMATMLPFDYKVFENKEAAKTFLLA